MVIDDSLLSNMGAAQVRKVLAPKMLGAWHLHRLTQKASLDFFVLYSSVATCFGNPGQGNYVAANTYMESLACYRRAIGLPALAVSWGPIADVGYLAHKQALQNSLKARSGGVALASEQALAVLERLLMTERPITAVADFDWPSIQRLLPGADSPKFDELRHSSDARGEGDQAQPIHELIANLSPDETSALITDLLAREVAEILRLPKDKLPLDRSVSDLGMDSLMGMELKLAIEERFGINLPVMALTEGPTIARIAELVTGQLVSEEATGGEEDTLRRQRENVAAVAARHAEDAAGQDLDALAEDVAVEEASGASLVR